MLSPKQRASLEASVDPRVVERARAYVPRVTIVAGGERLVRATVLGHAPYDVLVEGDEDGLLTGACTCPFFTDRMDVCKHIWAAVSVALDRDLLGVLAGSDTLDLAPAFLEHDLPGAAPDDFTPVYRPVPPVPPRRTVEPWRANLDQARAVFRYDDPSRAPVVPAEADLRLVLEPPQRGQEPKCLLRPVMRLPRKKGGWSKPRPVGLDTRAIDDLPIPPALRTLVARMVGAADPYGVYEFSQRSAGGFVLPRALAADVLPGLCAASLVVLPFDEEPQPLSWDAGEAWHFVVEVSAERKRSHLVGGWIERGDERARLDDVALHGVVVRRGTTLARLDAAGRERWLHLFAATPAFEVPASAIGTWLGELATLPSLPPLRFAADLGISVEAHAPAPILGIELDRQFAASARLVFDYRRALVEEGPGAAMFDASTRTLLRRDPAEEARFARRLDALGIRREFLWGPRGDRVSRNLQPRQVPAIVRTLTTEGWHVSVNGAPQRSLSRIDATLTSAIDWFDLEGAAHFGDLQVPLPELLAALDRGHQVLTLPDGSEGFIPPDLVRSWRLAARLGQHGSGKVRLSPAEALVVDRLIEPGGAGAIDDGVQRLRARLASFEGVASVREPGTFCGELRQYQRDALGWLSGLRELGIGGCLADDMGLGKTVVVLAWLEHLRTEGVEAPSLVVVPRSLVFNWMAEARRFAPALRVLDLSHASRASEYASVPGVHLAISTYGTLRRDVDALASQPFEYAILDEAQAIKNASTASAKAARALNARHRLALTGTPIENRLGDLWSLLEFANPALTARNSLRRLSSGTGTTADDRERIARAVRPFILRRTKAQVARDLPPRTEQTVSCELGPDERRLYDELRDHYRASLLGGRAALASGRGRMHVLEALLRLRQAACHPGLLDRSRARGGSAKLDQLVEQLEQVVAEGSKALVFSQFTSMLALVRERIGEEGWPYEYLDGQTKDRQARVDRFQSDPGCPLFLISLKAGGVGLNLTAAEYVFLLDPWWNPAVEAQAVDRTHRIGQTRPVFAYRLVARDTVEEKVLQLQEQKRALADAIVREDQGPLSALTREDLELLLS
jgi:superfamily II DNA or RNA helicase